MELRCLPTETSTTASSCSMDPLYDNCPPFAPRARTVEEQVESGAVCPFVSRFSGAGSPLPGAVPAASARGQMPGGGGQCGEPPESSFSSSCGGGEGRWGWGEERRLGFVKTRGEWGYGWGGEGRAPARCSPAPSESQEHQSALSLYDNLRDEETAGSQQLIFDMETTLQDNFQEQMYQAWVPGIQGMVWGDVKEKDKSAWSSCEMLVAKYDSGQQDRHLKADLCGSAQEDSGPHPPVRVQLPDNSPEPSGEQVKWSINVDQQGKEPLGSPRVPPPLPQADPSASALRSLLTSLQQQIVRQREEYEAHIISLEQRNEELQLEVVQLKNNLSQQRQWYQVVQAKIQESESARAAAELRNATLQREMEQFFDTFGELNNEAKKTEYIVKSF